MAAATLVTVAPEAATAVPAALPAVVPAALPAAVPEDGWRSLGRVGTPAQGLLSDASSSSGTVLVVGSRRTPGGTVTTLARHVLGQDRRRVRLAIGDPVAVDVDARGRGVVLSTRGGATLATVWRPAAPSPRTRVVLRRSDNPAGPAGPTATSLAANAAGDLAVLVLPYPGHGDGAVLVRRPADGRWQPPLRIGPRRYDAVLDAVAVTVDGDVLGAFKQVQTLSLRTLPPARKRFGAPTEVTTWSRVHDEPGSVRESWAEVSVGPAGDVATTWQVAEQGEGSQLVHTRLTVLPRTGRVWSRDYAQADTGPQVRAVGRDGSVLVVDETKVRRWEPEERRFRGRQTAFLRDTTARGDALLGSGIYGGRVRLWPVGEARGPEVPSPRGRTLAMLLTGDHRVYAVVVPDDGRSHRVRLLTRRL